MLKRRHVQDCPRSVESPGGGRGPFQAESIAFWYLGHVIANKVRGGSSLCSLIARWKDQRPSSLVFQERIIALIGMSLQEGLPMSDMVIADHCMMTKYWITKDKV